MVCVSCQLRSLPCDGGKSHLAHDAAEEQLTQAPCQLLSHVSKAVLLDDDGTPSPHSHAHKHKAPAPQ